MSLATLPHRAIRSLRQHGIHQTAGTARRRLSDQTTMRLFHRWAVGHPTIDRATLRDRAAWTTPTDTRDLACKGARGLPDACPQLRYDPGERFVATIPHARIIGRRGLVLDREGRIVIEPVGPPPIVPRRPALAIQGAIQSCGFRATRQALRGRAPAAESIHDPVAHIMPPFRNYYHWFIECIPRLRLLERHGERTGTYPTLLVPADRTRWMDRILEAAQYPGDIRRVGDDRLIAAELVVPTFPDPVREDLAWLRERFHPPGHTGHDRILVTREDAGYRAMANRHAVIDALHDRGFEPICPGRHTIDEQARLFGDADVIVGVHGAGLANVLWPTDATVVELTGAKAIATYARMAGLRGHDYHRIDCPTDDNGDPVVEVDALLEVIDNV